jgi:hypothetical protein
MKIFSLFFLSIALLVPVSLAGNFGPAPFRNGSPLVSGVDGTYQATARAENLTGIFRFAYSQGSQTESKSKNSWVFFMNGQVQRGDVIANINGSSLVGILDSSTVRTTNETGTISLPYVFITQNSLTAGEFSGKLQSKSPSGAFSGSGSMRGLSAITNNVIGISQIVATTSTTNAGAINVSTNEFIISNSILPITMFQFRGVRTSTTTSTKTTSN